MIAGTGRFADALGREGRTGPRAGARRTVLDVIRKIPAYLRLLYGLLTDSRVSRLDKAMVAGAVAYIIMPFDLIPDFIPFIGEVDDVYVLMLALQRLISHAGSEVVADHWDGEMSELRPSNLKAVLMAAAFFLPIGIRRRLRRKV